MMPDATTHRPPAAWRRLVSCDTGNVATMTALMMPVFITLAAIAVDGSWLYGEQRKAQSLADLAAITAARNIGNAEAAVAATLQDNGVSSFVFKDEALVLGDGLPSASTMLVSIVKGRYTADSAVASDSRFVKDATPYNGVRVSLRKIGTHFFATHLLEQPVITTSGVASATPHAAFSIGSRLASLNGGILNSLLGGLLGTNISLSVMDYEALLDTEVSALSFLGVLATDLNLTAGTYDDVLDTTVSIKQIATAMAAIPGIEPKAKAALNGFGSVTGVTLPLKNVLDLGDLGRLGVGETSPGLNTDLALLDILSASAAVANGDHQVELNLGTGIPGVAGVTVDLAIGEPPQRSPWFAIGQTGKIVRTAQTRLLLKVKLLGSGALALASIELPVYAELAFAEAKLTDISCNGAKATKVKVAARPGVAQLRVASIDATTIDDFQRQPTFKPAKIVALNLPLLGVSVNGQAFVEIGNTTYQDLSFTSQEIAAGTIKNVSTRNLTQSLTQSLLNNLQLDINIAGLGLSLAGLQSTLASILSAATPPIDSLLYNVLTVLGVRVGEADVRVHGAVCGRSVLVQ